MSERPLQATAGSAVVGRHAEMARLRAGLTGIFEGRGGMFLLSGEPGIGKTRLAEQLVREAEQQGATAFWGQSTQAEGAPPYWPWVQILRLLVRDLGQSEFTRLAGPGLAQILRMVPELRGQFPEVAPTSIEDDAERFAIYDSVAQLLLQTAARRPMVLVLEDLHWADAPSLVLLQLFADALPHSALMVIGTYRDRELAANHPLRTRFADFIRRGETAEIPVAGLTDADAASLVRALTAFEPAEDLVQRLQAQTTGNPFFLKELARSLSDETDEPSQWRTSADVLPEGVAAVLRRRIEGLSADCRQMLEVASVAGHMMELDVIEAVMGTGRPELLDLCDEAAANGVIATRGRGYAFTHGLFRDTIYRGLLTVRRAELHRAVGAALEQRTTDSAVLPVGGLAHHFAQAALADHSLRNKARGYAVAAGKQASAELAYEEAVRLFELALAIGGPVDPRERGELLLSLGRARYLAGAVTGAVEAAWEAAGLGERLSDSELLARAALVVRGVGGPGISKRIKDLCERALQRPPQELSLRIQLLGQMAVVVMQMVGIEGEPRAVELSAEAMRLAQDVSDPEVIFAAIHARQMAMSGPDGVKERLQLALRTLHLARHSSRRSIAQWGHSWRADALAQLGRIDEAETELSELRRLADELHEPRLRWRTLLADSWMAILRGRFKEARILGEEALALGRKIQRPIAEFNYSTHAGVLSFFVGPRSADLDAVAAYMDFAPEMQRPLMLNRAVILAGLGRLEEARFALRPFAEVGPKSIRPQFALLPAMAAITNVVTAAGDSELASAVYETLLPYAECNVATGIDFGGLWGSVARSLGMLAATLEEWDDAADRYEHAIAFESRMGAPPFVACTKVLYAEMLVRRGSADDLRYARRLASEGLATSQQLSMQPWLERAKAVLSRLETLHVADHPLSRREVEVALLVADGLSNRAIAQRLHLSERTAEGHVKNICDKLGFNSRSQVAAWVAARKLIQ